MRRIEDATLKVESLEKKLVLGDFETSDREEKLDVLAKSVATVSARKAAPMLQKADVDVAVSLLMRLGPKRAGDLLAKMDAQRAAALIDRIANKRTPGQVAAGTTRGDPRRRKP